jgi:hypothetical protein
MRYRAWNSEHNRIGSFGELSRLFRVKDIGLFETDAIGKRGWLLDVGTNYLGLFFPLPQVSSNNLALHARANDNNPHSSIFLYMYNLHNLAHWLAAKPGADFQVGAMTEWSAAWPHSIARSR